MREGDPGIEMEFSQCPLGCAPGDSHVTTTSDYLHGMLGEFHVVRCSTCGLMRTNPRPTPEAIANFYPSSYGPHQPIHRTRPAIGVSKARRGMAKLLGLESRQLPHRKPGRLLEIGCASGAYLASAREIGWDVQGIEFSSVAAERARAQGLTVQVATIESAQAPSAPADVVAMWMVLEHTHHPLAALQKIRSWMTPEGLLIGSVPDAGCLEARIFGRYWFAWQAPTHLFHFDPGTLRMVLAASGWDLVSIRWEANCKNLLRSMRYVADRNGRTSAGRFWNWIETSPIMALPRSLLSISLKATRQSGRMEFVARPNSDKNSP